MPTMDPAIRGSDGLDRREPGRLRVATRSRPRSARTGDGDAWCEVIPLPSGRLGVAAGTVRTPHASFVGELRGALRALALIGLRPAEVLEAMDQVVAAAEGGPEATLVYAEVDEVSGRVLCAGAGGCAPLIVRPDGSAGYMDTGGQGPLALTAVRGERSETVDAMPPGSTLIVHSDAFVRRRDDPLHAGLVRLADSALQRIASDPGTVGDALIATALAGQDGDAVVACVRRPHDRFEPLSLRIPAVPDELSRLRRAMGMWMADVGVPIAALEDVVLAASEAAANVVEHAYGGRGAGAIEVEMAVARGVVITTVRDHGRWQGHGSRVDRGRGIQLIGALMDEVNLHAGEHGTEVVMRKAL
jgi:serine/threonine-protein kinase RsbW